MADTDEKLVEQARSEAVFFNKYYAEVESRQEVHNYVVPERLIQQVIHPRSFRINDHEYAYSRLGGLEGKMLLDYGAGDGWNAICFAKAKANVWAIDISEKGVELIRKKANANGVGEYILSELRNCYDTRFPADMFDIVYGGGILHHLDEYKAAQEISRVLRSDGVAVFYEPIRDTKIMDFVKFLILRILRKKASEETDNEFPMTRERINSLKSCFKIVNFRYFNVLTSASLLINSETLRNILMWTDFCLMKFIPGFKKLGRAVVIELREPIKHP